jgi:predicted metal-dependent phosphotriesterase family hydrolase
VLGSIDPSTAGLVLPHEHLSISSVALQVKNKDQRFKEYENAPVTVEVQWGLCKIDWSMMPQNLDSHTVLIATACK